MLKFPANSFYLNQLLNFTGLSHADWGCGHGKTRIGRSKTVINFTGFQPFYLLPTSISPHNQNKALDHITTPLFTKPCSTYENQMPWPSSPITKLSPPHSGPTLPYDRPLPVISSPPKNMCFANKMPHTSEPWFWKDLPLEGPFPTCLLDYLSSPSSQVLLTSPPLQPSPIFSPRFLRSKASSLVLS